MTRKEIQAELDSLKKTRFDKLNDQQLIGLDLNHTCHNCGKIFSKPGLTVHLKTCEQIQNRYQKILDLHNSPERPGADEISRLLKIPVKEIFNLFAEKEIVNWDTFRVKERYDKVLELYHNKEKLLSSEIANILGMTTCNVNKVLNDNGLKSWYVADIPKNTEIVLKSYWDGKRKSVEEIAKETGISKGKIESILANNNLRSWTTIIIEENNKKWLEVYLKNPTITAKQIREIYPEVDYRSSYKILDKMKELAKLNKK